MKSAKAVLAVATVGLVAGALFLLRPGSESADGPAQRADRAETAQVTRVDSRSRPGAGAPAPQPPSSPAPATASRSSLPPAPPEPALASPEENARMERMAQNLKDELQVDTTTALRLRSEMLTRFSAETDPLIRMEIVTELSRLDDPNTVRELTRLLQQEADPKVREQIGLILGFMRSTPAAMAQVAPVLSAVYEASDTPRERLRLIEVMGNLQTPHSVEFLSTVFGKTEAPPEERFAAAEALFRWAGTGSVDQALLQSVTQQLRTTAASAPESQVRLGAIRALASPGQDNKAFLVQLSSTETDPEVRAFLELALQEFPTQ